MDTIPNLIEVLTPKKSKCKGHYYRGRVNEYIVADGSYRIDKRLVHLKRRSCSQCEECAFMFEDNTDVDLVDIPEIYNGRLYKLVAVDKHYDWETGLYDDFTLGFIEVNE